MNQLVESVCVFYQKFFLNLFHKKLGDSKSERIFAPLSKESKKVKRIGKDLVVNRKRPMERKFKRMLSQQNFFTNLFIKKFGG